MKYEKRQTATATMLLCGLLAGCAHTSITNAVPHCEKLIPTEWRKGVGPSPLPIPETLPDGHDNAKPWQEGYIAETGQREKADDRTRDTDYIYANCLANHREALAKSNKGFIGRLFSGIF